MSDDEAPPPPPPDDEDDIEFSKRKRPVKSNTAAIEDDKDLDNDSEQEDAEEGEPEEEEPDGLLSDADEDEEEEDEENDRNKRKRKKRSSVSKFFSEQADVAEDDEDDDLEAESKAVEEILDKTEIDARQRVARRHEELRRIQGMSAEEHARELEDRYRDESRRQQTYGTDDFRSGRLVGVTQQALLPSTADTKIWKVKCIPGKEFELIRSIMLKAFANKDKGGQLRIKSAFSGSAKGFIYIEGFAEPFAKEAIVGLHGLYVSSFAMIPVTEMTALLTLTVKKKGFKVGQWVRMRRGPLKKDLAIIVDLTDGGNKALVMAIPRPDYSGAAAVSKADKASAAAALSGASQVRPPQRLFDPEEVKNSTGVAPERRRLGNYTYDFFNNDYYLDGFWYKEVNSESFLNPHDVKPRIEEVKLFALHRSKKQRLKRGEKDTENGQNHLDEDEDDEDEEGEGGGEHRTIEEMSQNIMHEIAAQMLEMGSSLEEDEDKSGVIPYSVGDIVLITQGELKNIIGRVVSLNEASKLLRVIPLDSKLKLEVEVESAHLMKYIAPGAHVKVVGGRYMGQTGRVVAVKVVDGDNVAVLLTDGTNSEIQCNQAHLQVSQEVSTGFSSLFGYELYDLVILNENENGVITHVGAEKLTVINHQDVVKEVMPQALLGKKNQQSRRDTAYDSQQNSLKFGDSINVISGTHAGKTGTVKHVMKGNLWLHSTAVLKNSGIFVAKARSCVVAGLNRKLESAPHSAAPAARFNKFGSRDPNIGSTVRILSGGYKGLLGQITDVSATHYTLELLARMKKISMEKSKTSLVGNKEGSFKAPDSGRADDVGGWHAAQTPSYTAQTPSYSAPTPRGGDTPRGSETPGGYGDDAFRLGARDRDLAAQRAAAPVPGNSSGQRSSSVISSTMDWAAPPGSAGSLGSASSSGYGNNRAYGDITPSEWSGSARGGSSSGAYGSPQYPSDFSNHSHSHYSPSSDSQPNYSPALSAASPVYAAPPVAAASVAVGTPSAVDWVVNLVVVLKRGLYTGRQGVIVQINNGDTVVRLLDAAGRLDNYSGDLTMPPHDLTLVAVTKNSAVTVVKGSLKGVTGTFKAFEKSDAVLNVEGKSCLVRANCIAVIYSH